MRKIFFLFIICIVLTGCWDKRLLKEHSLILAIGYDLNDDGTMNKTVAFPQEGSGDTEGNSSNGKSNSITTSGDTVGDADLELEQILPQQFDRSKARVLLIGRKLAEAGVFSTLDSVYRDPRGPLSANVAIVEETAEKGLKRSDHFSFLVSDYFYELLNSAEHGGIVKVENVQSVCPIILAGGADVVLPLFTYDEKKETMKISGVGLFSGEKLTGELEEKEAIMYLILKNEVARKIKLNLRISDDKEQHDKNFVNFEIRKEKRDMHIDTKNENIHVSLQYHLQIEVNEFGRDHLYREKQAKRLAKSLQTKLTELAEATLNKMQEANNDSLGIGEKLKAYHKDTWGKIDWKETYPYIPIDVQFTVDIYQHGILN